MYLMIRNVGLCDVESFTLLGASSARGNQTKIGQFGSGAKHGIGVLLRHGISPTVYIGKSDKLTFGYVEKVVNGSTCHPITMARNGRKPQELSYTLEHGSIDWTELRMALREFIANAIDNSGNTSDIEIAWTEKPRAKDGFTAVFIPVDSQHQREIQEYVTQKKNEHFLHFAGKQHEKFLTRTGESGKLYFHGVYIRDIGESAFDYNVDNLNIDECRNADPWEARTSVAELLNNDTDKMAVVMRKLAKTPDMFESEISQYYLDREASEQAFTKAFGENAVLCCGLKHAHEAVARKGYTPVVLPCGWHDRLETATTVKKDSEVIASHELKGQEVEPATEDMVSTVDKVWELIEIAEMTKGKAKPAILAFKPHMESEAQTYGQYDNGTVYLHKDLAGKQLYAVALEEIAHHITGAGDMSRDLQEFTFRLVAAIAFEFDLK